MKIQQPSTIIIELPNGAKMNFCELEEYSGHSKKTLYGRWVAMGRPRKIKAIVMPMNVEMTLSEILSKPWCQLNRSSLRVRVTKGNGVIHKDDLKPIPRNSPKWGTLNPRAAIPFKAKVEGDFGDLSHLSDKENTGAGKGEIPNEIWINSYGRQKAFFGSATISFG